MAIMASLQKSFLLLIAFFLLSSYALPDSWSIDCGSAQGMTAGNITWSGDGAFVRSGSSFVIPEVQGPLATLRAFPKNKKNCYTIPVGIGRKIRLTASFYYGNYDNLTRPPSFVFIVGGEAFPVELNKYPVFYELIYVAKRNETGICVGRSFPDMDPLISAIDVRALEPEMYDGVNSSFALRPIRAVAFGVSSPIGFPEDPYNRMWLPPSSYLEGFNYTFLASSATSVNTSTSSNKPPERLFRTAAEPFTETGSLGIKMNYLLSPMPIYLVMYFSEVENLATNLTRKRSFHLFMDDVILTNDTGAIVPPFQSVTEIRRALFSGVTSNTLFKLMPTPDSTLPPIISAMEVLSPYLTADLTNNTDVEALGVLQNSFEVLKQWSGDPCLPSNYSWEWLNCTSTSPPRVTMLFLSGYGLEGELPDFSGLDALEFIDLHNNSLDGSIPEFLGKFPNLRELNLADNNFSSIPASLSGSNTFAFNTTGNPLQPPPSPENSMGVQKEIFGTIYMICMMLSLVFGVS